jgi:Cu+-exporting ATPase
MTDVIQTAAIPGAEACATTRFGVTGMTCAACVRRIEKSLSKVDGVASASVNLATEQATVVYDPAQVSFDAMRGAVDAAGYGIREEL